MLKNKQKSKQELFRKLQSLGICFILMVTAAVVSSAWISIASGSGLMPSVEIGYNQTLEGKKNWNNTDDGLDGAGNKIPYAVANNSIFDDTENMNGYTSEIVKWVTSIAGSLLALGIVMVAVAHVREDDPDKKY